MSGPQAEAYRNATLEPVWFRESICLSSLCLLLVCYRLGFTYQRRGCIGVEECMVLSSLASLIIVTVLGCQAFRYGFGHHAKVIPSVGGNLALALEYFWLFQTFYKLTICFNKLAFLTLYLRVFIDRTFRKTCWATIFVIVAGTTAFVVATLTQCLPVQKNWQKSMPGHCINNTAFRWSWAGFNTVTDIWVALLPITSIIHLQLSTAKKIGALAVFALGLFTCVASAIRMQALVQSTRQTDPTYDPALTLIWSHVEAAVGLVCTCLPSLRPIVSKFFPKIFTQYSKSGNRIQGRPAGSYRLHDLSDAKPSRSTSYGYMSKDYDEEATTRIVATTELPEIEESMSSSEDRVEHEKALGRTGIIVTRDVSVKSAVNPARYPRL